MYKNVGKKIMVLAQVLGWVMLAAGLIVFLVYMTDDNWMNDIMGWLGLAGGVLMFLCSWFTYGFGQLVDDVHNQRNAGSNPAKRELPKL